MILNNEDTRGNPGSISAHSLNTTNCVGNDDLLQENICNVSYLFISIGFRSSLQRYSVKKRCSEKFRKIHRKTPVLESLF